MGLDVGFYVLAGKLFNQVIQGKGTVQNLALSCQPRYKTRMYALLSECYKFKFLLDELVKKCGLDYLSRRKQHRDALNEAAFMILVYEFLWSPELKNPSMMQKFLGAFPEVSQNKTRISGEWTKLKLKRNIKEKEELLPAHARIAASMPRYARINTVIQNARETVKTALSSTGFTLCDKDTELSGKLYYEDGDIPGLLVFAPGVSFHANKLVTEGLLILQDKASCFPAHLLNPPRDAVVLDACAAPGNKTTQLAGLLESQGQLIAIEKDPKRYSLLQKMCAKAKIYNLSSQSNSATNCEVTLINGDFLSIDPSVAPFCHVTHILLDPSCSGSGMLARLDNTFSEEQDEVDKKQHTSNNDTRDNKLKEDRLKKLSNFQITALLHALSFPSVKEVVYSTCSIHTQENELVVCEILEKCKNVTLAKECLPGWRHRGQPIEGRLSNSQAQCLIRANPLQDKCNGFFVAKFIKK